MIFFTPGPVPTARFLRVVQGIEHPHHRSAEFRELFGSLRVDLQRFFQTDQTVVMLGASGAGAMEATIRCATSRGDRILSIVNGEYGGLWQRTATALGRNVQVHVCPPGESVRPVDLERILSKDSFSAVLVQGCETSTGVLNPIKEIATVVRKFADVQLFVDACSSLGAVELAMDDWGVDAVIASSQKVCMSPPGLSFVGLSKRAMSRCKNVVGEMYFDLASEAVAQEAGMTRFTPPVSTILSVAEIMRRFRNEPALLLNYRKRMQSLSDVTRAAAHVLGLEVLPESPSPTITVLMLPTAVSGAKLRAYLETECGIFVMGGFGDLADRIVRIGHMGAISNEDNQKLWDAILRALVAQGHPIPGDADKKMVGVLSRLCEEVWTK